MWYAIILLVTVVLAAIFGLGGGLLNFIDKKSNVLDRHYVPVLSEDIERNALEELKKK